MVTLCTCVCIRRGASVLHFHCGAVFEFLHLYINYSLSVVLYHLYLVLEMDGIEFLFFFLRQSNNYLSMSTGILMDLH